MHYPYEEQAGDTEDGIERQKLICTAIIEKKGRITATDLAKTVVRDVDEKRDFGYRMWCGDSVLYPFVKAGLPANYVGMFSHWPGIVSFTRACHPIGLVNACNPEAAAHDACEVGMLYQPTFSTGLPTAAAYVAGLAEACKANATRDSVYDTVCQYAIEAVRVEIDACLKIAQKYNDPYEMRDEMNARYAGLPGDFGEELLAKGLSIFYVTAGDVRADHPGRGELWPRHRLRDRHRLRFLRRPERHGDHPTRNGSNQCDKAEKEAEHTVSHLSCKETADGLYAAVLNEMAKVQQQVETVEAQA